METTRSSWTVGELQSKGVLYESCTGRGSRAAQPDDVRLGERDGRAEVAQVIPTVKFFVQAGAPKGEVALRMVAEAEREVGVKIVFEEPPQQNYNERLQILLVSGEYPDMIFFPDKNQMLIEAAKKGIIRPINTYLEKAPA